MLLVCLEDPDAAVEADDVTPTGSRPRDGDVICLDRKPGAGPERPPP